MSDQIDKIVNVLITRQSGAPSMASFNDVIIVDSFDVTGFGSSVRVQEYTSAKDMADAGFALDSYAYKCASKVFSQSPHISKVYVGWKNATETWTEALNAIVNYNNDWYGICASARAVADQKLVADFAEANKKLYFTVTGQDVDITANDTTGIMYYVSNSSLDRTSVFYHPDAKLTGTTNVNHTVYGLDGDSDYYDTAVDLDAMADDEARNAWKLAHKVTLPTGVTPTLIDPQPVGILGGFEAYLYVTQETVNYTINPDDPCIEGALFGLMFTKDPGSATYALKTLGGVAAYDIPQSAVSEIEKKNCNWYMKTAGIAITFNGKVGSGEYIDVIQGLDWLEAYIQNQVYAVLVNNDKIPYTDVGVQQIVSPLKVALNRGVNYEIINEDYEVTYPAVADVSSTDRANRFLPDVKFEAQLSGAIHSTKIQGVVSV